MMKHIYSCKTLSNVKIEIPYEEIFREEIKSENNI